MRIDLLARLGLGIAMVCFVCTSKAHADYVFVDAGPVGGITPITYFLNGDLQNVNGIHQVLPPQTIVYVPPSFNSNLGVLRNVEYVFQAQTSGSATTTMVAITEPQLEVRSRGHVGLASTITLINDGVRLSPSGNGGSISTIGCLTFPGPVATCTQNIDGPFSQFSTSLAAEELGDLQLLIELEGDARLGLAHGDFIDSSLAAVWEMDVTSYAVFHFDPPRPVPLPPTAWLFLSAVGLLGLLGVRIFGWDGRSGT